MRRPLFGNGFPARLLFDDGNVKVFDTNDFTPQEGAPQAFAVTLYCWAWQFYAPSATIPTGEQPNSAHMPSPFVSVVTDGGTAAYVAARMKQDVILLQDAMLSSVARPIKMLDRFVVRGDQQIFAQNLNTLCTVANNRLCFIYGYYEAAGEVVPSLPFRGLQPNNVLKSPFSEPPVVVDAGPPSTTLFKDLHLLTNAYLDLLDINVIVGNAAMTEGDVGQDIQAALILPAGRGLPIPVAQGRFFFQSVPFEHQPMIAPSSSDALVRAGFEDSGSIPGIASQLRAYGSFTRR